jgi:hypothetical protein
MTDNGVRYFSRLDFPGPADNERHACSPVKQAVFPSAERAGRLMVSQEFYGLIAS